MWNVNLKFLIAFYKKDNECFYNRHELNPIIESKYERNQNQKYVEESITSSINKYDVIEKPIFKPIGESASNIPQKIAQQSIRILDINSLD